jgi:hypothetical protein
MSQPLDASRVYRWQQELVELVAQVTRAHIHSETVWIEWKSEYDLIAQSGQIARYVLGFANRGVARARQYCEGYAYLVVGADPERGVVGITSVDLATLIPRVATWTGSEVRWHPNYVSVQGKDVLVVVIEPPRDGDPIFPLRKPIGDTMPEGRVFVRRGSETREANASEIDVLSARVAAGGSSVRVAVTPIGGIEAFPKLATPKELADAERQATLDRPIVGPVPGGAPHQPSRSAFSDVHSAFAGIGHVVPDRRSREDYEGEVAKYAEKYQGTLDRLRIWRLSRHEPLRLRLAVSNRTDVTLERLVVQVTIAGAIRPFPEKWCKVSDCDDEPELPQRPDEWGTPKVRSLGLHSLAFQSPHPVVNYKALVPGLNRGPSYTITATDTGMVIQFDPVELRAHQQDLALPAVPLRVSEDVGTELTCEWSATAAGNVRGIDNDRFIVAVTASSLLADGATAGPGPAISD